MDHQAISELFDARDFQRTWIADLLGVSPPLVNQTLHGDPNYPCALAIAVALDRPLADLWPGQYRRPPNLRRAAQRLVEAAFAFSLPTDPMPAQSAYLYRLRGLSVEDLLSTYTSMPLAPGATAAAA